MTNVSIIMEVQAEESAYRKWERAEKNRILAIHDIKKKQEAWNKLFPVMVLDDSWLNEAEVF